jgi:hypothetical protein
MSIAEDYSKILFREVKMRAAWLPISNNFAVGDFGVICDGVFQRMGNVRSDLQVEFQTAPGGQASKLDFKSEQVRSVRLVGDAAVNVFPGNAVDASLRIEFEKDRSFYLKTQLTLAQMTSVFDVASRIALVGGWNPKKYKVISGVYTGQNCVILSSRKGKAEIVISGKSDALQRLEMGKAEASLQISSSNNLGLEIVGDSGVVGLDLFSVKPSGEAELESLLPAQVSQSKDWGAELEDDV